MSKILKLKEWLSLEDAAAHLSLIAETAVKPQDLVQFAIGGDIRLSLFMSDHVHASETTFDEDGDPYLVLDGSVDDCVLLSGLADFAQFGSTEFYSWLFTLLSTGDRPKGDPWIYLEQNAIMYQPMRLLQPNQFPNASDELVLMASSNLPDDSCVVIRVTELNRLEAELGGKPLEPKERLGLLNIIAAMADMMLTKGTFSSQQNLSVMLAEDYDGVGISSSNIDKKIAEGKKSLQKVKYPNLRKP